MPDRNDRAPRHPFASALAVAYLAGFAYLIWKALVLGGIAVLNTHPQVLHTVEGWLSHAPIHHGMALTLLAALAVLFAIIPLVNRIMAASAFGLLVGLGFIPAPCLGHPVVAPALYGLLAWVLTLGVSHVFGALAERDRAAILDRQSRERASRRTGERWAPPATAPGEGRVRGAFED